MPRTPEDEAREIIDEKLTAAGWYVQDRDRLNLSAGTGIAVREFPLEADYGFADYLLYVAQKAIGVVEAKPIGTTLTGVEPQSARYSEGLPRNLPAHARPLPFAYESTGKVIRFTNGLEPDARSRDVFHFHRPETLLEYVRADAQLRTNLRAMPQLDTSGLWPPQVRAVRNLERSLAENRPRALIQMATGSGKTFLAANSLYRLIKHAGARRILFLVDRNNLGIQAEREFKQFQPPDDARRFEELYNIQRLTTNSIGRASRIVITTVQRLYSMLCGEEEFEAENESGSMFDSARSIDLGPREVQYNPAIPIETFDFIVVDECHRSIYNVWRQVLEYFDAFIIGLTATPSKQTIGFFNQNLVMEYTHPQAVADGINVNYDVFRIRSRITEQGSTIEAGLWVDKRDRQTREVRQELLDEDLGYGGDELDRSVVAVDQIRTVIRTFRDALPTQIFPGRTEVPKTLIYAKDDSHAEDIVQIAREEFSRGNDFCQKITYRTGFMRVPVTGPDGKERQEFRWERISNLSPEDVLAAFRNSYNPRIAVTVDMIATGTDVKPLEIVMFMRDVKSLHYFEQMKGRGVRVISPDELRAVTSDAKSKTHFVIVDAVGVCEKDKTESRPLIREPSLSLKKMLNYVAMGGTDSDVLSTLAGRLARLERGLSDEQRSELQDLAGGVALTDITAGLVRAVEPDAAIDAAREGLPEGQGPTEEQVSAAAEELVQEAVRPFHNPDFRQRLLEIRQQNEQTIDHISADEILEFGFDEAARERVRNRIESFRRWIEENKDEILALQLLYSGRWANRLRLNEIEEIAKRIARPPVSATAETLWEAYEALEQSKVRGRGGQQLVDLVTLIRHAINPDELLIPFREVVMERYKAWLAEQERVGEGFTNEQRHWLDRIADHIATSLTVERDDFELGWFATEGSLGKAYQLFGDRLDDLLAEMNEKLVA